MNMNAHMLRTILCASLILLPVSSALHLGADPHYGKHRSDRYNYEIIVPARWQTDEVTLEKKHVFVSFSGSTEIKVRAFITDEPGIDKTIRKRSWNLRAIDPNLNRILETEKITVRKNISGKLLVFEYRSRNRKVLQRTMITRNDNWIYIVDCKAPVRNFYRNEENFNIALSSFKFLRAGSPDESGEDGGKAVTENDEGLGELDDAGAKSAVKKDAPKGSSKAGEEPLDDLE